MNLASTIHCEKLSDSKYNKRGCMSHLHFQALMAKKFWPVKVDVITVSSSQSSANIEDVHLNLSDTMDIITSFLHASKSFQLCALSVIQYSIRVVLPALLAYSKLYMSSVYCHIGNKFYGYHTRTNSVIAKCSVTYI